MSGSYARFLKTSALIRSWRKVKGKEHFLLCWVVVKYCELVIMYVVIYFLFVFFSCEYDCGFYFVCFCVSVFNRLCSEPLTSIGIRGIYLWFI
jgi:hypothetical protein